MKEYLKIPSAFLYHRLSSAFSKTYRGALEESGERVLEDALMGREQKDSDDPYFIGMVGFTHSGKTYVSQQLHNNFPNMVEVESRKIHDVINGIFPQLNDDRTVQGSGYWLRQVITRDLRNSLIADLCKDGWWIINDSANLVRKDRQKRISIPESFGYKSALIWVTCPEEEILRRIDRTDNPKVWRDLYQNIQKPRFEPPEQAEAGLLLVFKSKTGSVEKQILPYFS